MPPEENKPSLTGEEVSNTPETDAAVEKVWIGEGGEMEHIDPNVARGLERRLSTARAQDKATISRLEMEVHFWNQGEGAMRIVKLQKDAQDLRAENKRLKESVEAWKANEEAARANGRALAEEVARLKAEVEANNGRISWLEQQREFEHQQAESALLESGECLKQSDDLLTRLAQAEKERDEWKNAGLSAHDKALAARDLAEQNATAYQMQLENAEQRVRELEAEAKMKEDSICSECGMTELRYCGPQDTVTHIPEIQCPWCNILNAASCPSGTDLAAWVGQLAEDKRRLDWLSDYFEANGIIIIKEWDHDGRRISGDTLLVHKFKGRGGEDESLRSAIDASTPNPHDAFIHADQQDDAKSDASNPKTE